MRKLNTEKAFYVETLSLLLVLASTVMIVLLYSRPDSICDDGDLSPASIARRNAILNGVSKADFGSVYEKAKGGGHGHG